jgi:alkylation response protein AidB-like acyl-CoA dehydrogenase
MDFDFSDDQEQLRDAVRRWVDKGHGFERHRATVKAGGDSREVWQALADLGLTGLAVPEAHGGMGWGATEAMVVMEELGRGLVLAPYAAAALVAPTLLSAAPAAVQAEWLPKIASGEARVVLAQQERASRYRLDRVATTAVQNASGDGWQLSGTKSLVPVGDVADAYVVSARAGDTLGLWLVERSAAGVTTRGYLTQDGGRAAEVQFDHAAATLVTDTDALAVLEHAADVGTAALCAEAVGAMDFLVQLTADYMNTRKQFGVAIASFQALRHRLADCKMQLELGRSMAYLATLRLGDAPAVRRRAVSQAKVQLGQSMRFVGQQCVQLHGGIGVTDEYVGSHYFKRLSCMELQWGDTLHHLGEVSARMQDTAGVFA